MDAQGSALTSVTTSGSNNQAKQPETGAISRAYEPASIQYVEVRKSPDGRWRVVCIGGASPGAFACQEKALQAGRGIARREGVELRAPDCRSVGPRFVLTGWRE